MEHRNVLILRLSAVGDVIRALPAVKALKEHWPSSRMVWMVEDPSKALLESQPEVDEVILFPRKRWAEGIRSPAGMWRTVREAWQFVRRLRERRFDIVLDFHGILKSGLISFLSGSPRRIGFDRKSSKEGNFVFSNVRVKLQERRVSRIQRNFALLKGLGLEADHGGHRLHIPREERQYIDSFLNQIVAGIQRPFIAIHPGTSPKTLYKRWMADRYSQLADRLIRELKATVIFTWGPDELGWVEKVRRGMEERSFLGPRTETLTQLGEVFNRCDLYVGGDTGPMHIASSMGIPVIAIYGPTDPVVNEPFGQHRKVRKEVGCNPCRKRSCKELHCLRAVTVDDVFQATQEILSFVSGDRQ